MPILEITGMKPNKHFVLGLVGGSGTGKTYIGRYIASKLQGLFIEADLIGHDLLLETSIKHLSLRLSVMLLSQKVKSIEKHLELLYLTSKINWIYSMKLCMRQCIKR